MAALAASLVLSLLPRACGGGSPDPQCEVIGRDDTTITLMCPTGDGDERERKVHKLPRDQHPGCQLKLYWPVCQESR